MERNPPFLIMSRWSTNWKSIRKGEPLIWGLMKAARLRAATSDYEINRSTYAVMHLQETWDMAANEKPPVNELNPIC